jgi:hypothetical protein
MNEKSWRMRREIMEYPTKEAYENMTSKEREEIFGEFLREVKLKHKARKKYIYAFDDIKKKLLDNKGLFEYTNIKELESIIEKGSTIISKLGKRRGNAATGRALEHYIDFLKEISNDDEKRYAFTKTPEYELLTKEIYEEYVQEGGKKLVTHSIRERNKKIVEQKKQEAIDKRILRCEVCDFSFIDKFGIKFIECHHKTPISQTANNTKTTLKDLGLVCSNCHSMLHIQINGKYLTMEELKALLKKRKNSH